MKTISISKAQGIGDERVESVTIIIDRELPDFKDIKTSKEAFEAGAENLADALCAALPGGTLDRLIDKLLMKKATSFNVPLFK